jgi:hypothetical protein
LNFQVSEFLKWHGFSPEASCYAVRGKSDDMICGVHKFCGGLIVYSFATKTEHWTWGYTPLHRSWGGRTLSMNNNSAYENPHPCFARRGRPCFTICLHYGERRRTSPGIQVNHQFNWGYE